MVHSKHITHTTNIKLEPYSIVSDTSTVASDYASVASNESLYNNSHLLLDGRPIFGPWPKPKLPIKSHSESNHIHELAQFMESDIKKSSSDTTMDIANHYGKPTEMNTTTVSIPLVGKYGIRKQKLFENNLKQIGSTSNELMNYNRIILKSDGISDTTESKHSFKITSVQSPNEQNKFYFQQFQQNPISLISPIKPVVSMLTTKIGTPGESSTDQDLEINEPEQITIRTLEPKQQSIQLHAIPNDINNKLTTHSNSNDQQKQPINLLPTESISSVVAKPQRLMDSSYYQTALSQVKQQPSNGNSNNICMIKEKCANELINGIGKILRKKSGGIAELYKNNLEMPNSRFCKILYSMIA